MDSHGSSPRPISVVTFAELRARSPTDKDKMTMDSDNEGCGPPPAVSSGPLRIHSEQGRLWVVGFGLRLEVRSEEEGLQLIAELEEQGYKICY